MYIGHHHPMPKRYVPAVVTAIYDLGIDMEFNGGSEIACYPETGHKYNHVVAGVWGCELGEGRSRCLRGVVYLVEVVLLGGTFGGYVDLCSGVGTMLPAV